MPNTKRDYSALPHARAAWIRELARHKKARDNEQMFLVEGIASIRDIWQAHADAVVSLVVTPEFLEKTGQVVHETFTDAGVSVSVCSVTIFASLTSLSTSTGILAVVRQPVWNEDAVWDRPRLLGLYAEAMQDPANVGAIIRTAVAFDLDAVWLSADCADLFNPKVVRAAAGSLLDIPVFRERDAMKFSHRGCDLFAAEPPSEGSRTIQTISEVPDRVVIAVGNEGRGLSNATRRQASMRFHIPMSPRIDSFNVGASAAIALFYFRGLTGYPRSLKPRRSPKPENAERK